MEKENIENKEIKKVKNEVINEKKLGVLVAVFLRITTLLVA